MEKRKPLEQKSHGMVQAPRHGLYSEHLFRSKESYRGWQIRVRDVTR